MPAALLSGWVVTLRMVLDRLLRAAPEGPVRVHVVDHVDPCPALASSLVSRWMKMPSPPKFCGG